MIRKAILSTLLLVALAACNMSFVAPGNGSPDQPTPDAQLELGQAVTQTFVAQTQIALGVQQTMAMLANDTPSLTPSITLSLTPEKVMVSVSIDTNCRSGPGTAYDILGMLPVGQSAEVIARSVYNDNWIIKLPSNPAITCWLWGYYAMVVGDTVGLPALDPPPTPTPASAFTFSYHFWGIGPGFQCLLFDVTNTGSTTWESYSISIHDTTHGDTGSGSGNEFINYDNWCGPTLTLLDLTSGETGTASGIMHMIHSPSGDHFEATLTLCSQNSLNGNCMVKSITFIF